VRGRHVERLQSGREVVAVLVEAPRVAGRSLREWPRRSQLSTQKFSANRRTTNLHAVASTYDPWTSAGSPLPWSS
jgi:hypothetical protein